MKRENRNFMEIVKKNYEERQETVMGIFVPKKRTVNPADYYLRKSKKYSK